MANKKGTGRLQKLADKLLLNPHEVWESTEPESWYTIRTLRSLGLAVDYEIATRRADTGATSDTYHVRAYARNPETSLQMAKQRRQESLARVDLTETVVDTAAHQVELARNALKEARRKLNDARKDYRQALDHLDQDTLHIRMLEQDLLDHQPLRTYRPVKE